MSKLTHPALVTLLDPNKSIPNPLRQHALLIVPALLDAFGTETGLALNTTKDSKALLTILQIDLNIPPAKPPHRISLRLVCPDNLLRNHRPLNDPHTPITTHIGLYADQTTATFTRSTFTRSTPLRTLARLDDLDLHLETNRLGLVSFLRTAWKQDLIQHPPPAPQPDLPYTVEITPAQSGHYNPLPHSTPTTFYKADKPLPPNTPVTILNNGSVIPAQPGSLPDGFVIRSR